MPRLSLLLLLLSFTFFTACTEENKEIFEAQACLDRATPATAMSCAEKVSGKNNQRAYVITCGARFLARGLDEQKIAAALEEISDDTGGTDPTSTAIANLAVMDDFENPTNFDQAFADGSGPFSCCSDPTNAAELAQLYKHNLNSLVDFRFV
jgi:hypothetical protein